MHFRIALILIGIAFNSIGYGQTLKTDLDEIANQFTCLEKTSCTTKRPELFIFVSLSMPKQSLQLWSQQAEKVGGTLLLRGFVNNSFQETIKQSHISGFNIDPEKFTQYHIKQVPAVVLTNGSNDDTVYGDTSLESALEYIAHHGSNLGRKQASDYLKLIRKSK